MKRRGEEGELTTVLWIFVGSFLTWRWVISNSEVMGSLGKTTGPMRVTSNKGLIIFWFSCLARTVSRSGGKTYFPVGIGSLSTFVGLQSSMA